MRVNIKYNRKEIAKDDVLDALSTAITARFGKNNLDSIPKKPELDSRGLPMEMAYKEISRLHFARVSVLICSARPFGVRVAGAFLLFLRFLGVKWDECLGGCSQVGLRLKYNYNVI